MEIILSQLLSILKSERQIIQKEAQLNQFLGKLMRQMMGEALEVLDKELAISYLKQGYKVESAPERSVTFFFGTVNFKRRRLKDNRKTVYPLDELLCLRKKQRFSVYTETALAESATLNVYRKTSEVIGLLTPFSVSHQKLRELTVQKGLEVARNHKADLSRETVSEKKQVPILYVEGDAFCVRQKGGGLLYVHRFQVCEGRESLGKDRHQLTHYKEFVSLSRKEALSQLKRYIEKTYDTRKLIIVSNSDGGSGYESSEFSGLGSSHEHFIDRYHVHKKLKERLRFVPDDLIKTLQSRLYGWDKEQLEAVYTTIESWFETQEDEENFKKLQAYIRRNWAYLKPFEKRSRLKGFSAVIGTCESNHRAYTYRMKKQGKYWSRSGATAMMALISAKRNGDLAKYSRFPVLPKVKTQEINVPRSIVRKLMRFHPEKVDYSDFIRGHIPDPQLNAAINHAFSHY
jgi:hypothetical protein